MARVVDRKWVDSWAYDVKIDVIKGGEVWDVNVINQSIEMILGTITGERLFNPSFGSNFQLRVFDSMDEEMGVRLLDDVVRAIKTWEDRVTIVENEVELILMPDSNAIILTIPYIINDRDIKSRFQKKIIV